MDAVMSSTEFRIQTDRDPPNNGSCAVSSSSASAVFRKIEFHPARKTFNGFSNRGGSDFKMETLNPSSGNERALSAPSGKKPDGSDLLEHGLDPELTFSITFRKIVSVQSSLSFDFVRKDISFVIRNVIGFVDMCGRCW